MNLELSHYIDCPICKQTCKSEQGNGRDTPLNMQGPCQVFLCHTPLANAPLHYYSHIVDPAEPNVLAYQEFSIDLGGKYVLFANDFTKNMSVIRHHRHDKPLEFNFLLEPDFPTLSLLAKKIRTVVVFS